MDNFVQAYFYNLRCSIHKMEWYDQTGEIRYLDESRDYLSVANIYMREITKTNNIELEA